MVIRLFDVPTATALSQILPIILLALMVELRRTKLHRRGSSIRRTRFVMALFFTLFALIETILVLSIDGRVFPFQGSDLIAALIIFAMLWALFVFTFLPDLDERHHRRRGEPGGGEPGGDPSGDDPSGDGALRDGALRDEAQRNEALRDKALRADDVRDGATRDKTLAGDLLFDDEDSLDDDGRIDDADRRR